MFPWLKLIRDRRLAVVNTLSFNWQVRLHLRHLFHLPCPHLHLCVKTAHLPLHVKTIRLPQSPAQPLPQSQQQHYLVKIDVRAWFIAACLLTFYWCVHVHLDRFLTATHLLQTMVTVPAFLSTLSLYFWILVSETPCWVGSRQPSQLGTARDQICKT